MVPGKPPKLHAKIPGQPCRKRVDQQREVEPTKLARDRAAPWVTSQEERQARKSLRPRRDRAVRSRQPSENNNM